MAMGPFGGNPLAAPGVNPLGASTGLDIATPGNGGPMGGVGSINAGNVAILQALMGTKPFGAQTPGASTPPVTQDSLSPQDFMSSAFSLLGANPSPLLPLTGPRQQPATGMPPTPQASSAPQATPPAQSNSGFRKVTTTTPSPTPNIPAGWHEVGTNQQGVIVQPLGGAGGAYDPTGAGTGNQQGWLYDPTYSGSQSGPLTSGRSDTWIIPEPPPQTTTSFVKR